MSPLRDLALVFLRLGFTAFGGPAAHIAMMEDELVRRRRWLTQERFLDLFGVASLIPGPSSTELAIYIGYEQAGWRGLVLGGACFILPAAVLVGLIAWGYVRFGMLPAFAGVLYGIKPVVIGVVVQALWGLAPRATKKSWLLMAIGAGACTASALDVDPLVVLIGCGLLTTAGRRIANGSGERLCITPPAVAAAAGAVAVAPVGLGGLFLVFLKIGAIVFGSGYVLLAFLRADLVDRLHWISEAQLLDAVAVGQVTPGPVFTSATFIGYVIAGAPGAAVATVAIFLPGFALVAATRPFIARLRAAPLTADFLDGVNVASLALMAVVTAQLARTALVDAPTIVLAIAAAAALIRWKLSSTWLIAGGVAVGVAVHAIR